MVAAWSRMTWETSGRISRTCQWHDFEEVVVTKTARFGTWIGSGLWTQVEWITSRGFGAPWVWRFWEVLVGILVGLVVTGTMSDNEWLRKDLNPTSEGWTEKDDLAESGWEDLRREQETQKKVQPGKPWAKLSREGSCQGVMFLKSQGLWGVNISSWLIDI